MRRAVLALALILALPLEAGWQKASSGWSKISGGAASGSSTPGGATTQVQFNDAGSFAGNAGLTYQKASNALSGTGPWTLTPGSDLTPLTARAYSSGTANIFQWQKSDNSALGAITHDGRLSITGASVATDGTGPALGVTATLPASPSAEVSGVNIAVTGAGNAAYRQLGMSVYVEPGYTGSSAVIAQVAETRSIVGSTLGGNIPFTAGAATFGAAFKSYSYPETGTADAIGVFSYAGNSSPTTTRIGVVGFGRIAATAIGGMFLATEGSYNLGLVASLDRGIPSNVSAALLADNASASAPIVLFRDNGTTVFSVDDATATQTTYTQTNPTGAAKEIHGSTEELVTLNTGGTSTITATNLAPANAIIDSITYRITTTITTATAFTIKVTGGNVFNSIGTATSAQSALTAGTTGVLVPNLHADQYNATATTLTIDTTGTPGAGVIRLTVFYRQFVAPTS